MFRMAAAIAVAVFTPAAATQRPPARDTAPLSFRIDEGRNINAFVRQGPVAAHLLLRSGEAPRILAAFPAGNSGVGLWFEKTAVPVRWTLDAAPVARFFADPRGRMLHGAVARVSVDARTLRVRRAVLSSVRVLRDFEALGTAPDEIAARPRTDRNMAVIWQRDRLDGAPGYWLGLKGLDGTIVTADTIRAGRSGRIALEVTAATGEPPLVPRGGDALLTAAARPDQRARDALAFLSYREKYLAGSWRFDTYFGRDTLMSLRLLMPVLQPQAIEDGIGSILARLADNGEVAHEEDIGEFAVLRNAREGRGRVATPIYDYAMIDDDFMLAPVARAWLVDAAAGRRRAAAFLAADAGNMRQGDRLMRNFTWVVERSAAFASDPRVGNLVALKGERQTGQWRDSNDGLGLGVYPYDVNAVWVPAALDAIVAFEASGMLARYGTPAERRAVGRAARQAAAWRAATALFRTELPSVQARAAITAYARTAGVPARAALASVGGAPLAFNALSLDARGRAVPVVHSDDGFALLFGDPDAAALDRSVAAMMRPFPAGLMTDIGLLVANPAFASADLQRRLGASAYHGTVVWSWQQAVLAAGLDRQIERRDLPAATRNRLIAARAALWRAIDAAAAVRTSELWSWTYRDGRYAVVPFGASNGDADESNAAQLWSTVFLALRPPARPPANR